MRNTSVLSAPVLLLTACSMLFAAPDPPIADDAVAMVLAVNDNGTRFCWQLEYGLARQRALAFLKEGKPEKALCEAKKQFILCPLDTKSVEAAIKSVSQMLLAVDGHDARARAFEDYATHGPQGPDGKVGTEDDLANPIAQVRVPRTTPDGMSFEEFKRMIDNRAAVSPTWAHGWYETEKAFAYLNAGHFDDGARILIAALSENIRMPHAVADENWELQRIQDIVDRIKAGLGAVHRAKTGTVAGVARFVDDCTDYARYGPMGKDGRMGTVDDLVPPL